MMQLAVESDVTLQMCVEDGRSSRPSLSFRSSFFVFSLSLSYYLSYHASARSHLIMILQVSFSIGSLTNWLLHWMSGTWIVSNRVALSVTVVIFPRRWWILSCKRKMVRVWMSCSPQHSFLCECPAVTTLNQPAISIVYANNLVSNLPTPS